MALTPEELKIALARAKDIVAQKQAAIAKKKHDEEEARKEALGLNRPVLEVPHAPPPLHTEKLTWNEEQQKAIDFGFFGKSFCLIGSAGTGKTTVLKAILRSMMDNNRLPPLERSTKHLTGGAPGVALISYTRRAVRNIAKQMPDDLKAHCVTYHKLVEYEPHYYDEWDEEKGDFVSKMRFEPSRNASNTLPRNLKTIIVDEASMLSIDYWNTVLDALPDPSQVQFIFLGDLNQLPPVYGQAILGKALLELPIIELTRVYRQALESPIISCALAVKNNNFEDFNADARKLWKAEFAFNAKHIGTKTVLDAGLRGRVTLHPWKKTLDKDDALHMMQQQLNLWIKDGTYDPEQDLVLCPWNTSFGTNELNLGIADYLAKRDGKVVHEVIAGFNKFYFAVGDKLLVDKQEAIILAIASNPRYLGKLPQPGSVSLNRWGLGGNGSNVGLFDQDISDTDIDLMLAHAADVTDRTTEASHAITVRFLDSDEEDIITKSSVLNATTFAYAITVHKAQGSECRRVFFLTHDCHAAMCSRELVYTAITRAAEELYVVMPPNMLSKSASKPRIKGDSLSAKLEFFQSRLQEKAE